MWKLRKFVKLEISVSLQMFFGIQRVKLSANFDHVLQVLSLEKYFILFAMYTIRSVTSGLNAPTSAYCAP